MFYLLSQIWLAIDLPMELNLYEFEKGYSMMMTAAGTVPAKVLAVIGAGVAGLQAIATAKRLGAVVSTFDVRLASKEQVESLGGKFLTVEDKDNLKLKVVMRKKQVMNIKRNNQN